MKEHFLLSDYLTVKNPDNIFIFSENKNYSIRDALNKISDYRGYAAELISDSPYTAVHGSNSADYIFLLIALWQLNKIPVLINTRLETEEIEELLRFTNTEFLFTDKTLNTTGNIKCAKFPPPEFPGTNAEHSVRISDPAVVIFTSGSTGKPKAAELSFKMLFDAGVLQNNFLQQQPDERWILSLPLYHIGGFSIIVRALFYGLSIIIPESLKADDLARSSRKFQPQYISVVGTQLKRMIDQNFDASFFKNILIGGGFTDDELIRTALSKNWNISKVYGSTETAAFAAAADRNILEIHPASTGREINPGSITILDESGNLLPPLSEGAIALKNIPVIDRYLNNPDAAKEKFRNGFFITGDIGYLDGEGNLFVVMRREDLIISGGENINPFETEREIKKIPGIEDVYVFGVPDAEWGQTAAAAVKSNIKYDADTLKQLLTGKIAAYKIPKKFFFVEQIPRTELGKIQSEKLKGLLGI